MLGHKGENLSLFHKKGMFLHNVLIQMDQAQIDKHASDFHTYHKTLWKQLYSSMISVSSTLYVKRVLAVELLLTTWAPHKVRT